MNGDYRLGHVSRNNLAGVRVELVRVCERAISISPVDFGVTCGLRPLKTQIKYFEEGRSKTLKSYHLIGHAIDVSPYARGRYRADCWPLYYPIAEAFLEAAIQLSTRIVWGGAWGVELNNYNDAQEAQLEYIRRKEGSATDYFFDGPHFQLSRDAYPPDFSAVFPEGEMIVQA